MSGLFFHRGDRRHGAPFRPLRRSVQGGLLAAGSLAAALAAASPASADTASTYVVNVLSQTLEVESNGQQYTKVANPLANVSAVANVALDAEVSGGIKNFKVWLKLRTQDSDWTDFPQHAHSESFAFGQRPKAIGNDFLLSIPSSSHGDLVVSYCNGLAQDLRAGGMSDQEIFAQDRPIDVAIVSDIEFEMSGFDPLYNSQGIGSGWPGYEKMQLVCKGIPPRVPPVANDPTRTKPHVKAANLVVKGHDSLSGACSMNLLVGLETAEPEDHVKFRFESNDGQKSDVKSVITDGNGIGQYAFDYALPAGGTKSGQVRIIGVSENFSSPWRDYEVDCGSPAQDVVTVLPPKAIAVEAHLTGDEIMHRGLACPAKAKIYGIMKGRGEVEGGAALFADGKLQKLQQYSIEDGQTVVVQGDYAFDWTNTQLPQQNVKFTFNIANKGGDLVDHIEATQNFECRKPQVSDAVQGGPDGYASNDNLPKSVTLSLSTLGQKKLPGWVCPEKVRLHGNVMSDDQPLSGTAILYVGNTFIQEHDVELEANWGHNYDAEYELSWNAATQTEQTLDFTLKFANEHNYVVKTVEKTESFACQKISTTGIAGAGGLTGGQKPGQASQQAATGVLVQPQALPLAIMAPKGRVRNGEIRLSGGKPTQTYKLTFFRKSGGKTTQVSSAQLPKQMKGMNAKFPLAALSGGRTWQLRVCPVGQGPAACKTSDFRIPLIGAKQDKTAPTQPKATVVIVPGALN